MVSNPSRRPFVFVANHIVLDFINTVNARPTFTRDDLAAPDDVVEWASAAGLGGAQCRRGDLGAADLDDAVALREHLYGVFGPIAAGREPHAGAVTYVTDRAADAIRSSELIRGTSGFELAWSRRSFESIAHELADEALRLLRSPDARRVGACDGCGWLFLDTSRAHARRWCAMNACGARHKMRRYHQRQVDAASIL